MNVLIIGGSGKTGRHLIKQGLSAGHNITVLARNPFRLQKIFPSANCIKGDVLKAETLGPAFQSQEAVLCALGPKRFFIPSKILSRGTQNILDAMKDHGVKRIICITALGINDSKYRLGLYYTLFTIPFILYFYFRDKAKQEVLIQESGLEWTIVRPSQFIPGKKIGNYKHGPNIGHYILTKLIRRAAVAHFMLKELQDSKYVHEKPGISY